MPRNQLSTPGKMMACWISGPSLKMKALALIKKLAPKLEMCRAVQGLQATWPSKWWRSSADFTAKSQTNWYLQITTCTADMYDSIAQVTFHRSPTCITPCFDRMRLYFLLMWPLWTTSMRSMSTCPSDS